MNVTTLFSSDSKLSLLLNADENEGGWSGSQFFKHVAGISWSLQQLGICASDRILILTGNCVETFAMSLAAFGIGAVAVPTNPLAGPGILGAIVKNIGPSCCFFEDLPGQEVLRALAPSCRVYVSLRPGAHNVEGQHVTFQSLLQPSAISSVGDFPPDHPALIIHTSGSQGKPKSIHFSHQALLNSFCFHDLIHRQYADSPAPGQPSAPLISVFHPSHLASYCLAFQGFLMLRPTILMRRFIPRDYLASIARHRCRVSILVPPMYAWLVREAESTADLDLSSWQICCSVGERTPEALALKVERTFGVTVLSCYGLTECLPGFAHRWQEISRRTVKRGSCGKRLFDEQKLIDDQGNTSNPGQLLIRNATVRRCYVDDRLNQEKLQSDGWLKTGDLFFVDDDGNYFHQGRIDDMFALNGKNVYPAEIEFALLKHPDIERAVAAPIVDQDGNVSPAALVQSQTPLQPRDVLDFYLKNGPLHAIPQLIISVPTLPELGSGKLDRKQCQSMLQSATLQRVVSPADKPQDS